MAQPPDHHITDPNINNHLVTAHRRNNNINIQVRQAINQAHREGISHSNMVERLGLGCQEETIHLHRQWAPSMDSMARTADNQAVIPNNNGSFRNLVCL